MLEFNKIYCCDVMEGLKKLDDNSIDLIITSPPYNKAGLNGIKKGGNWCGTIDYNDDVNVDNKEEREYQKWQIKFLDECFRVLKDDGSMFYNHKNRIVCGEGEISNPYLWIIKSKFKVRQEIIWDRCSSVDCNRRRFIPSTEKIFWLAKNDKPYFDRKNDTVHKNEVWRFPCDIKNDHPAPFPIDLPNNIIHCCKRDDRRIVVLDPFMGSGTVAASAIVNDCDYIGFEKFEKYVEMINNRIKSEMENKKVRGKTLF